jgi:hypothetical protein
MWLTAILCFYGVGLVLPMIYARPRRAPRRKLRVVRAQ